MAGEEKPACRQSTTEATPGLGPRTQPGQDRGAGLGWAGRRGKRGGGAIPFPDWLELPGLRPWRANQRRVARYRAAWIGAEPRPSPAAPQLRDPEGCGAAAAAAVAATVALRARAEPGSQPGGPSPLRTPGEPDRVRSLIGRGSRPRGERSEMGPRHGRGCAWARGACVVSSGCPRLIAQLRGSWGPRAPAPALHPRSWEADRVWGRQEGSE